MAAWALMVWLAWPLQAQAAVQELQSARAAITVNDSTELTGVSLPYNWDVQHRGVAGKATFEVAFSLPAEPSEPYGVYFSRLGNAYEVWLNGTLLQRNGDMEHANGPDFAKAPRYVEIAPQLLQTSNLFRIQVRADGGRRGGVPVMLVGPDDEVREIYRGAYRWRVAGSLVVSIFSLLVGGIAIVLWVTQRSPGAREGVLSRDSIYLFAGIAELSWALRMGDAVIEQPWLPWPWWGVLVATAYAAWICFMTLFCHQVAGLESRRSNRVLGTVFVSGLVSAAVGLVGGMPRVWTAWLGLAALAFVVYGVYYSWQALRRPSAVRALVSVAVMTNVLAGLHDWLTVRLTGHYSGEGAWIPFTSVLFGLTLGYIVVVRFRTASAQVQELMATLSARVAQKESELAQSYRQLETLAREQERIGERARILRDMHDGVGSHISAAIRQLQSGKASSEEVLQTLRDSLDQLKLSIDAMHLPAGDVTALLANMRYRLEPRFAASDIELQWAVDLVEPLERLDASAMRQLQFMVFEALSNVLQHAQASVLRIEARAVSEGVLVCIVDNGRGFDVTQPLRKGLLSMRERAAAIGASVRLYSQPGRTVVEILLV